MASACKRRVPPAAALALGSALVLAGCGEGGGAQGIAIKPSGLDWLFLAPAMILMGPYRLLKDGAQNDSGVRVAEGPAIHDGVALPPGGVIQ